jgi:hypothetical protein
MCAGIIPATSFLRGQPGIKFHTDGSIIVDELFIATQDVLAAGDVARFPYKANTSTPGVSFLAILCANLCASVRGHWHWQRRNMSICWRFLVRITHLSVQRS